MLGVRPTPAARLTLSHRGGVTCTRLKVFATLHKPANDCERTSSIDLGVTTNFSKEGNCKHGVCK